MSRSMVVGCFDNYDLLELIGQGTFAAVYKASCSDTPNLCVAIKAMKYASNEENCDKEIEAELKLLSSVRSPFMICYHGTYRTPEEIRIVLELCEGGSLGDVLSLSGSGLTEDQARHAIACGLLGLRDIHAAGFLHRDVKEGNMLLTAAGTVKLCDFGSSTLHSPQEAERSSRTSMHGTAHYMSPELIDERGYSFPTDIWSLGVTLLALCDGAPPHSKEVPRKAITLISQMPSPCLATRGAMSGAARWSADLVDFLYLCLRKDPMQRASVRSLLEHSWMRDTVSSLQSRGSMSPVLRELFDMRAVWREAIAAKLRKHQAAVLREERRAQLEREEEEARQKSEKRLRVWKMLTVELLRRQRIIEEFVRREKRDEWRSAQAMLREEQDMKALLRLEEIEWQRRQLEMEAAEREQMYREDEGSYMERRYQNVHDMYHGDWVCKQSEYLAQWNPRFFTVKEGVVRYYDSDDEDARKKEERGVFILSPNSTVSVVSPRCLSVQDLKQDGSSWTFTIRCATEEEVAIWIQYIKRNILFVNQCAALTPFQVERAVAYYREGWIEKQSDILGTWNMRYFVVDSGVIRYYSGDTESELAVERGKYILSTASDLMSESIDDVDIPPNCVLIYDSNAFTGSNWSLMLHFSSADEKKVWTSCFEQHMSLFVVI